MSLLSCRLPAILLIALPAFAQTDADLVLFNGKIYTVNSENAVVEALAVAGGRILAVGSADEVLGLAGETTQRIDLAGRTVYPGFIDAHGHLLGLGASLQNLDFVGTASYEEIVDMVAEHARQTPQGQWITGRGWDQNDWSEKNFPNHEALSLVSPNNPVYLTRIDGHAALANGVAMQIANINKDVVDPSGGKILRDAGGEATGVFIDRAQGLVARHIPGGTREETKTSIRLAIGECLKYGLTSIHDPGVTAQDIAIYKELIDAGDFDLRVYAMIRAGSVAGIEPFLDAGPLIDYGDGRLTVRSFKLGADGALGSRGAALLEPYADDPENTGLMILTKEVIEGITRKALAAGFQVCTHAIGDRGNRTTLDAYESALRATNVSDPRLRIEHAQIVALEDIPRFAKLGVIPSMQATHATSDMYWAEDRVGPARIQGAYAWRKLMDAGCRIANGSDFPVEGVNPLWGLYAAVTRQDKKGWPEGGWQPGERMTRTEALRSFTIDAAYAAFEEGQKGSLEVGKLADMVVLSRDIMEIPAVEMLDTHVVTTILGGRVVYQRP